MERMDLQTMQSDWKETRCGGRLQFSVYQDPKGRYFALSPVASLEKIQLWIEQRLESISVIEALKQREDLWSRLAGREEMLTLEEWFGLN
jgi:hypothetical protein